VLDDKGQWVDTLPIEIKPGANLSQLIRKQQVALNDQQYGLVQFTGSINKSAICEASYKHFDGYFLNYTLPAAEVNNSAMGCLNELVDLASKEGILVPGVHYLITEHFGSKRRTISYMTNFVSKRELLNTYSQHVAYSLSLGVSGSVVDKDGEVSAYIVDKISLRIRIPTEYKPKVIDMK